MNLWVKRTGQLLLAALFLMSCEDDSFLLGYPSPNNKFDIFYKEFLVGENGKLFSIDSVITSNLTTPKRLFVGDHTDDIVGNIHSESFMQILPNGSKLLTKSDHVYKFDSMILQLRVDSYSYGLTNTGTTNRYNIHKLTSGISFSSSNTTSFPTTDLEFLYKTPTYQYTHLASGQEQIEYADEIVGQTRYEYLTIRKKEESRLRVNLTLDRVKEGKDTLLLVSRIDDAFGEEIFNVALNDADGKFTDQAKFTELFKGLAIIPDMANSVIAFNPTASYSALKLYYHTEKDGLNVDTLSRDLILSGPSFYTIKTNRVSALPQADPAYTAVEVGSNSNCVIQSGSPVAFMIDINDFYEEFANDIDRQVMINTAELVVEPATSVAGYSPLSKIELRLMKEDAHYLNYRTLNQATRDSLQKFGVFNDSKNYYIIDDQTYLGGTQGETNPVRLRYNQTKNIYTSTMTVFVQRLLDNRNSNYKIRYIGLYPNNSTTTSNYSIGQTLDRTVFLKSNVKLRIYYTIPNKTDL